ncbi:MAG TPA: molecular chaperone DnaJ [Solirubrobacteraceae bacterium]|nr:molecular chaperone DnaJ [Solirubrobacteraceae bacterium]
MASTMPRDYYEVLGLSRSADDADLKGAFRRLARELHPDVSSDPHAEEKFKEAAEAYDVLSDPERRATYDRYGHEGLRSSGYASRFEGFGSFADIFEAFFGGGDIFGGGRRGGPAQGGDVAVAVEIDLADVAAGKRVDVSYQVVARCDRCQGNGAEPGTPIETCGRCRGAGQLQSVSRTPFGQVVRAVVCDSCGGDGKLARDPCTTCRGEGRIAQQRSITVEVPPGIADGQRIRLGGRGHDGDRGPSGDLYVHVRVGEDERFMRDGEDLVTAVDVPSPLAALGTRVVVPSLDGEVEIEVPAGTQPGQTLTLTGRGLPPLRRGRQGDLRVVVNVVVPRELSDRQRELARELADSLSEQNLRAGKHESLLSKLRRALRH